MKRNKVETDLVNTVNVLMQAECDLKITQISTDATKTSDLCEVMRAQFNRVRKQKCHLAIFFP